MTPRPGLAAAVAAIQSGGEHGIDAHVMLFTNARPVWDPRSANISAHQFAAGSAYSCNWTTPAGKRAPVGWDSYPYGLMADLGTNWVQQTWGGQVAAHALQAGADAIYLDQLACSSSVACHGAVGHSWASGGRGLLAAATAAGQPSKPIGFVSEEMNEQYMADLHGYVRLSPCHAVLRSFSAS